jgi:hypothetical protein
MPGRLISVLVAVLYAAAWLPSLRPSACALPDYATVALSIPVGLLNNALLGIALALFLIGWWGGAAFLAGWAWLVSLFWLPCPGISLRPGYWLWMGSMALLAGASVRLGLCAGQIIDRSLARLHDEPGLEGLDLAGIPVTDGHLLRLRGLTSLRVLDLHATPISDAGLAVLVELPGLEWLDLSATNISDAGLAQLRGLTRLRHLNLGHTRVSSAGLAQVQALASLQRLDIAFTRVTESGIEALQQARPDLHVFR